FVGGSGNRVEHGLARAQPVVMHRKEARAPAVRQIGDEAERDGIVRVEVEVVVGLEIRAAEAQQRAHPAAADLGLRGEPEKAARRRLAGEQRLSPRQAEPMLESGARLLKL